MGFEASKNRNWARSASAERLFSLGWVTAQIAGRATNVFCVL